VNLHGIAAPAVAAVNPLVPLTVQISTGYATGPDGSRAPAYAAPIAGVPGQVQALTFGDLRQVEALNLQGIRHAIYINGRIDGLVRTGKKGGDLITTPDGAVWLVVHVLEYWPDFVKVAVTLQNDHPGPVTV
jgi:hypothetical protein